MPQSDSFRPRQPAIPRQTFMVASIHHIAVAPLALTLQRSLADGQATWFSAPVRLIGEGTLSGFWLAAPLVVGVAGVLIFLLGIGHLFGGRPMTGAGHFLAGGPLAIGGPALGLLGLNTQTYARLTHEGPVAEVSVKLIDRASNRFAVTVHRLDGSDRTRPASCRATIGC